MNTGQLVLILMVLLAGCSSPGPTSPEMPGEPYQGQAVVETLEVVMLTSFPLQVHLHVSGYLGDPCTEIKEIQTQRHDYQFEVTISTERAAGADCIQVIEPFEQNIPLDVYGLPAGDYLVQVNGVEAEFSFSQDNILGQ
jgi:inhibitor of cysteine peptidase